MEQVGFAKTVASMTAPLCRWESATHGGNLCVGRICDVVGVGRALHGARPLAIERENVSFGLPHDVDETRPHRHQRYCWNAARSSGGSPARGSITAPPRAAAARRCCCCV